MRNRYALTCWPSVIIYFSFPFKTLLLLQVKAANKLLKTIPQNPGYKKVDGVPVFSAQNLDIAIATTDGIKWCVLSFTVLFLFIVIRIKTCVSLFVDHLLSKEMIVLVLLNSLIKFILQCGQDWKSPLFKFSACIQVCLSVYVFSTMLFGIYYNPTSYQLETWKTLFFSSLCSSH